jgi:hypothetical protein
VPTASSNVRVRGLSGRHMFEASFSQFDPKQAYAAKNAIA